MPCATNPIKCLRDTIDPKVPIFAPQMTSEIFSFEYLRFGYCLLNGLSIEKNGDSRVRYGGRLLFLDANKAGSYFLSDLVGPRKSATDCITLFTMEGSQGIEDSQEMPSSVRSRMLGLRGVLPLFLLLAILFCLLSKGDSSRFQNLHKTTANEARKALDLRNGGQDNRFQEMNFEISDFERIESSERIELVIATYFKKVLIASGSLSTPASSCVFESDSNFTLRDNSVLSFRKKGNCDASSKSMTLRLEVPAGDRLALWTTVHPPSEGRWQDPTLIVHEMEAGKDQWLYPAGQFRLEEKEKPWDRIQLLAYMWGKVSAPTIWVSIGVSALFLFLGILAFPRFGVGEKAASGKRAALSLASLFFGFASLYAVLTPPFQGPDEADHFLTFLKTTDRPDQLIKALELANLGDFDRIKFHPEEKFVVNDTFDSRRMPWPGHVNSFHTGSRSPFVDAYWKLLGKIEFSSVAETLLTIRLGNALSVSLSIGFAAWLIWGLFRLSLDGIWILAPFFLVPSLPFFAMHVSNYPFLIACFLIQATLVGLMMSTHRLHPLNFLLLGFFFGLGCMSSSNAILSLAFLFPMMVVKVIVLYRGDQPRSLVGLFGAVGSLFFAFAFGMFAAVLPFFDSFFMSLMLDSVRVLGAEVMIHRSLLLSCGIIFLGVLFTAILFPLSETKILQAKKFATGLIAVCLLIVIVGPVIRDVQPLPNIEPPAPEMSPLNYIWQVLKTFIANFGMGYPDFYLSTSFWLGFGWLDVFRIGYFAYLIKVLPLLGLSLTFLALVHKRGMGPLPWILGGAIGIAFYLSALAVGALEKQINLHGRYMIGLYLFLLVVSFARSSEFLSSERKQQLSRFYFPLIIFFSILLHTVCMITVITRYI